MVNSPPPPLHNPLYVPHVGPCHLEEDIGVRGCAKCSHSSHEYGNSGSKRDLMDHVGKTLAILEHLMIVSGQTYGVQKRAQLLFLHYKYTTIFKLEMSIWRQHPGRLRFYRDFLAELREEYDEKITVHLDTFDLFVTGPGPDRSYQIERDAGMSRMVRNFPPKR